MRYFTGRETSIMNGKEKMSDEEKLDVIKEMLTPLNYSGSCFDYKNGMMNVFKYYWIKVTHFKSYTAFREAVRNDLIRTKSFYEGHESQEVRDLQELFCLLVDNFG